MPTRTFQSPETRLPFINGEIAQVQFQGAPHLVSGVWANEYAGGRIYFWNPLTDFHAMRKVPKPSPGVYMLQVAADGRLYLGDGRGDLYRYDPAKDAIETLVTDKLHNITWGGCITDGYAIWTTDPGEAGVYDFREEKFVKVIGPLDSNAPHAHYGHYVRVAPDGKVLFFLD